MKKNDYESNINANIVLEPDGRYHRVRLQWVPRVGDELELQTIADGKRKRYEVVHVRHDIRDIVKDIPQSHDGYHYITLRVKPVATKDTIFTGDLLSMLARLAFALNETIDGGKHHGITIDRIHTEIERGTLFHFIAELPAAREALNLLEHLNRQDSDVQERLLAEWRGFVKEEDFRVARDGLCQLLAYVIGSIHLRTDGDGPWPEAVKRVR